MPSFRAVAAALFVAALCDPALVWSAPALAQPEPDWTSAQAVTVDMKSFAFTPDTLSLRTGQPYRLHLVNTASGGHSFEAPEFFAAAEVAPDDQAKIKDGNVELDGGSSVDIKLVPKAAGTFKFKCSHFLHAAFGMTGAISVSP